MKSIKGSATVLGTVTAGGTQYPTSAGAPGEIISSDGSGGAGAQPVSWSRVDAGVVTADPAPVVPTRMVLDASAAPFGVTLPAATGSQDSYLFDAKDLSNQVTVSATGGSVINGEATLPIPGPSGSTYTAVDKASGQWSLFRSDFRDLVAPSIDWEPNRVYAPGERAILNGYLLESVGHTSQSAIGYSEWVNWVDPSGAQWQVGGEITATPTTLTGSAIPIGNIRSPGSPSYCSSFGPDEYSGNNSTSGANGPYVKALSKVQIVLIIQYTGAITIELEARPNGAQPVTAYASLPSTGGVTDALPGFLMEFENTGHCSFWARAISGNTVFKGIHSFRHYIVNA